MQLDKERLERQKEEMERQAREREEKEEKDRLARLDLEEREEQKLTRQQKEQEEREKEQRLAQEKKKKEQQQLAAKKKAEQARDREERQARIREQEEREHRIAEREADLRKAEEQLLRPREERARRRDPESDVADVEVEEPEPTRRADTEEPALEEAEAEEETSSDLSGWWELTNRIQATDYKNYVGLRLGYRIKLEQDGNRITGRGQKWAEDGRSVAGSARSPIRVSGTIDGDTLTLEFTEQGARRSSSGSFKLRLSDRTTLRGSFSSNVAGTSGSTLARRMP
jgi:multidrug efflux pump subunit AcrA (membrane-fusion protein)